MSTWLRYTEINVATGTSQNVTTSPAELVGAWVTTVLSAHAVTINDGASGTNVGNFAASAPVNTKVDFEGILCEKGINLVCNAAGTGKIIVAWRAQD